MQDHQSDDLFSALSVLSEIGIRLVPELATRSMCHAGAAAGDVDAQTALRIYNAMLIAAAGSSLHGDQLLN